MVATIPADIIQYYSYTLRTTQKLLYLYGFPEIGSDEEGETTIFHQYSFLHRMHHICNSLLTYRLCQYGLLITVISISTSHLYDLLTFFLELTVFKVNTWFNALTTLPHNYDYKER